MSNSVNIFLLTLLALIAFAANSVIARMALLDAEIGPWSYTLVRLLAGTLLLVIFAGARKTVQHGNWGSALALLAYAGFFSIAYVSLPAGIGALILFAAVQLTMIGAGVLAGERLTARQLVGALAAFCGLIYLLNPGINAPSVIGASFMAISGIGWGLYSLRGRRTVNPTRETAGNFVRATALAILLVIPFLHFSPEEAPTNYGLALAVLSGAITSGLGYVVWYRVLPHISTMTAGISQLTVPAIAAAGGIVFLAEDMSWRFGIASAIILGGVALATISLRRN